MSARADLARLRALSPVERRLFWRALILYVAYRAGVRIAGLRAARHWFAWLRPIEGASEREAIRMVLAVAIRAPLGGGCLPAALTLQRILSAQAIESELRLGVRRVEGRLEAHAWLERDGRSLIDTRGPGEGFASLAPARIAR